MAKKNITAKIDIPKWYKSRIKNFEILREKEALFEYESIKIQERARKQAKKLNIAYNKPKIVRPSTVIASDIQILKDIELETIKEAVQDNKPIVPYTSTLYAAERVEWKRENLPDYHYEGDYDFTDYDYTDFDSEDDYLTDYDIKQIESNFPEPEPTPPLFVDMSTGQAIFEEDLPDFVQHCKELIDDLIRFTEQQADQAIVSYSSYRSGRTKSSSSRQWLENNINKATDKIIDKLEEIKDDDGMMLSFAKKCASSDYLQSLNNAIGDYISGAYSDVNAEAFYSSQVYNLLSFSPMSLDDTMDFEYEE